MSKKIEISQRTILFTLGIVAAIWLLTQILDVILIIFVSIILMAAFKPSVDHLEKLKIPHTASIVLVYLTVWLVIGAVVAGIVPPLVEQSRNLISRFPGAIAGNEYLSNHGREISAQLLSEIGSIPTSVVRLASGLFGNVLNVITTVVISFYLLLERKNVDKILSEFMSQPQAQKIERIIAAVELRLGGWIRGELLLMICVGLMTFIGLTLLGVESALPLAILAGMLEIIPNIGPTVSAIPAVIVALTIHPLMAVSTVALYILVQSLENNLLVPQIMSKSTGINPLVSIISLMIGFRLAGVAGAVLAIPLVLSLQTIRPHIFGESSGKI